MQNNNKKMRRWIIAGIGIAVIALAVVLVSSNRKKNQSPYRTETVDRGSVTMQVTATGTLSAVTTVQVGSQVSGIISKLYADFNSRVKKGQLLAELDPTPFQAAVAQQRANLVKAQVDAANDLISFTREKRLLADGLAAQSDYDAAKAAYDGAVAVVNQAKASLQQAETNLKYTKIVSPIDGVVVARQYDVGQTVAASFQAPTLFTIAQDLTKMQVEADVDQSDIGRVKVGEPASFTVDAYPEQIFRGKIAQVRLNATVSQNVVTYPVMIDVPNPDQKLRPNMTANVTIDVAHVANVLRIPNAALRFRPPRAPAAAAPAGQAPKGASLEQRATQLGQKGGGFGGLNRAFEQATGGKAKVPTQTVYVLEAPDRLKSVPIRTGISDGHFTEVVEGDLQPGDRVVVGLATARAESSGRPPGMGRRF
jgi:HlyD family secretion protein